VQAFVLVDEVPQDDFAAEFAPAFDAVRRAELVFVDGAQLVVQVFVDAAEVTLGLAS
jgi:hypothetical protein